MGILEEIVRKKAERLYHAKSKTPLSELKAKILDMEKPRDFKGAIKKEGSIRLIAEVKKASPSRGIIREDFKLKEIAELYHKKADAISVLTEEDFFIGSLSNIKDIRSLTDKPILRKDFIFDEYQIYESRANSSDAILLIAGILSKTQAREYYKMAEELNMAVLFEIHDLKELEMALLLNVDIIGINNRDLKTLKVDLNTTFKLKREIPSGRITVSESGIKERKDVIRLEEAGIDAMLVGEVLMSAKDIGKKIEELRGE